MPGRVVFETGNTWTSILEADEFILGILDKESKYPTPQALAYAKGFKSPEGESKGWDGWIRLLHRPRTMYPYFPTGLTPKLTRICQKYQYTPYVKDLRVRPELGFPELVSIPLRDYQEAAVVAGLRAGRGVFDCPPRCHSLEDLVLLANGSVVQAQEVTPRSELMGPDGTPRKVLEIHTGKAPLFRIHPRWSEPFTVTGNTILVLEEHYSSRKHVWDRRSVEVTVDEWLTWSASRKRKSYLLYTGIPFPESSLPIPPYLLGILLGDGAIQKTITITSGVPEIQDAARELAAYFDLRIRVQFDKAGIRVPQYYISQDDASSRNPNRCMHALRKLGLGGKHSRQKFLPSVYLHASRKDRLDLLAGLLDTDGHLSKDLYYEFSTASRQMCLDVLYLARSLGFSALSRPKVVKGWVYWRINIFGDICEIPLRCRKKQTKHRSTWRKNGRASFTVEPVGVGDFVGWSLGGDHRYLTAGFVVNHNSGKTRIACELQRRIALPTIWIAPTDRIVDQTVKVISGFFGRNYGYHLVGTSNWPDAAKHNVVVCTMATAAMLPQEFYDSRQMIVLDEFHHCFSDTTQVFTDSGSRDISNIKVGDLVWSCNMQGLGLRAVRNVWKRKAPPSGLLFRVTTTSGILEVTGEHCIYTPRGKVKAQDLRAGDAVYLWKMRESDRSERPIQRAYSGMYWPKNWITYLRKLWKEYRLGQLWGASVHVPREESFSATRNPQEGNGKAFIESGLPQVSIGAYESQESHQGSTGSCQDQGWLARLRSSALWSWGWWQRSGTNGVRKIGGRMAFALGVSTRGQGANRRSPWVWALSLVFPRFGECCSENSSGSGWERSSKPRGSRCSERLFLDCAGLVGVADPCETSEAFQGMAIGHIVRIESVSYTGSEVYDLEVEGNHNYFANGVLVSNSSAKSYTCNIFPKCDHIHWRFGMTGTFFRSGYDAMAMHGLLSNTIYKVQSSELSRRGFLIPTKVAFVPVPAHPKLRGAGSQFNGGFGKYGIHEHAHRNQLVANAALLLHQMRRKVLILVGTKAQGREINHRIHHFLPQPPAGAEFDSVEFLSTDRPRDVQIRVIESFLAGQEVKILLGTSLLGEGVDLPYVDALVYARGEKAEVSLTQNAYRVCTAVPGKHEAIIIDFADRHHRMLLDHSEERLEVYYREPTFDVTVLDDANGLPGWLEKVVTKPA